MPLINDLENHRPRFWLVFGVALVALLGIIDYLTGYELSFSLFYLAPITLVSWYGNQRSGLFISVLSAITWFVADFASGNRYANPAIFFWNTLIRLGFFLIVTSLMVALKRELAKEKELTRTDYLTGAATIRHFYELAQTELNRLHRYQRPLTMVYIDLDDFKQINDRFGHSIGDKVLCHFTRIIRHQIRNTDIVARLGGDEFAMLLPETGEADAQTIITRLQPRLLAEMESNHWPVTISMGVVTFLKSPGTVDAMVGIADSCMYSVKMGGKNRILYLAYPAP
jgi:diguanylate cyclase (GGDEF)-like protein